MCEHHDAERDKFTRAFVEWGRAHRSTHVAWLAEVGGDAVGMAWLALAERVPAPGEPMRRTGDVQGVYVLLAHRDRGIGARLVGAVVNEAHRRGVKFTWVRAGRRSLPLYRRLGFGVDDTLLRWHGEDGGQG